ncbi:DUF2147 domain-containing protein [Hyphomonas johnsonii]|uniref:DUF2147 domain-containing protein n=1 Tax=Hyphomonas johnsonii MHS-2 TaxID=1280950 RepID=A0A059FJP1_9PROT|nr:DUF2147 domain-containing protein [Hyphomonas johnsonii]KCZ90693.1 hypothetical protein HJO_12616 [Hyphomonas johnsonii MHS-2]
MKPVIFSLFAITLAAGHASAGPLDVFGTFATEEENSHVEIADCGDGTPCGTIVWIDPASVTDGKTPDTATDADGKKILGLTMLQGFEKKAKGWAGGTIYNPKEGKTYSSRMKRLDDGVLEVKGCIAMLCKTQNWKPVG